MKEIIIFSKSPHTGDYIRTSATPFPSSDGMLSLENFLESDVRHEAADVIKILTNCQNNKECDGFTMNVTDLEKLPDQKIAITYMYIDDLQSLIISFNELVDIIQQWGKSYEQRVPYIILERNDDSYSVRGAQAIDAIT